MKLLTDDEVLQGLAWPEVLRALEAGFRLRAESPTAFSMPERVVLTAPAHGSLLVMPCADEEGWFGVKQVAVLPGNEARGLPTVQAWYTLFDPAGRPVLASSATLLTRVRTAAVSALAARYLAPQEARSLLVVGTGSLAPWLAEAHAQVRPYAEITVWGRNGDKAKGTAADIRRRLGGKVLVRAADDLEPAARAADVITLATTAKEPVLRGEFLRAGQHLDLVGAFLPEMREVDAEAVTRAEVYVDDVGACKAEAGDLIRAEAEGWSFAHVRGDLAALVAGEARRESGEALTLFKSVGLALEDLVVAKLLV